MTSASNSRSISFCGLRPRFWLTTLACCLLIVLTSTTASTTALSTKDVLGQAIAEAKSQERQRLQPEGGESEGLVMQVLTGRRGQRQRRSVSVSTTSSPCAIPTDLTNMFQQINSGLSATKYLGKATNGKAFDVPKGRGFHSPTSPGPLVCPTSLDMSSSAPISDRQLCPHTDSVWQLPSGYYPPSLPWAHCNCTSCVENDSYSCQPLYTSITVLRPSGCFLGMQMYEEESLEVPTACTCTL